MTSAFIAYLKERLPQVESALKAAGASPMTSDAPAADLASYLYEPLARFTASGGKRVRPVLALLGAEAVGAPAEAALPSAVAVELFQSAALIHDDIADASELRRGEKCLYLTEGTGPAINVGDLALTEVFNVVLTSGLSADAKLATLAELANMERHTLEGQALDLGCVRDVRWDVTVDDYLYMVISKTAWYSAASPLKLGAIAGGAPASTQDALVDFGMHAGIAFQIQDDLLNLVGDAAAQGKDFRSDVTEGKRTLAVVWALAHLDAQKRDELVALLGSNTANADDLARAVELIELGGGIEACRKRAADEVKAAKRVAGDLAARGGISERACTLLCSMADFFVERAG